MRRLSHISVPDRLQRNAPDVLADGVENTGHSLLSDLARRIGREDLSGLDLLDIGCGVRFTQTLINRALPFKSYTGIEVFRPIVDWLREHVENHDDRFHFAHWNVQNSRYNPNAPPMTHQAAFPTSGQYDLIMGFSLVTHFAPKDTVQFFRLARNAARPGSHLFFSALCDDRVDNFEDRVPDRSLLQAYYNKRYLEDLIQQGGWSLISHEDPQGYIMDSFLCGSAQSSA